MINTKLIKNRMCALGISMDDLARDLSIPQKKLKQIIENEKHMVLCDAYLIAERLHISDDELTEFFFCAVDFDGNVYAEKSSPTSVKNK